MSTAIQQVGTGIVLPGNMTEQVDLTAQKSLMRYIWQPFGPINLLGPDGLMIRLGKGVSYYTELLRCQAYPLWNVTYNTTRYEMGKYNDSEARAGNPLGANASIPREEPIYAGETAADMTAKYGDSHGLRVLTPLSGMDGAEQATVSELIRIVQPFAYKLDNLSDPNDEQTLLYDLNYAAKDRIAGAGLDKDLRAKAEQLRSIMAGGVNQAIGAAKTDWGELSKEFARTALGKPGKTFASVYDEHLAYLLGQPVPSVIKKPETTDTDLRKAVTYLVGRSMQEDAGAHADGQSLLDEIRAERAALVEERLALEALKDVKAVKK